MSIFSNTIAAALAGEVVGVARLVEFDLQTGDDLRFWEGAGWLDSVDGKRWAGAGELLSISEITIGQSGEAPEVRIGLSGVDVETFAATVGETPAAAGRTVRIYLQYFAQIGGGSIRPTDAPVLLWQGTARSFEFAADGPATRRISATCESRFALRSRPPYGAYTDRDQQSRFPGDRGLEFVSTLTNKTVTWPDY